MRSTTTSNKTPNTNYTYSPSVPISVYRELAAELQAAEALLDSLNAQNQHLAKHNQKLRQEIAINDSAKLGVQSNTQRQKP